MTHVLKYKTPLNLLSFKMVKSLSESNTLTSHTGEEWEEEENEE